MAEMETKAPEKVVININKILDEARVLGCSDVHFTTKIAPVVRLHGSLRRLASYPEMTEAAIMKIVEQIICLKNI